MKLLYTISFVVLLGRVIAGDSSIFHCAHGTIGLTDEYKTCPLNMACVDGQCVGMYDFGLPRQKLFSHVVSQETGNTSWSQGIDGSKPLHLASPYPAGKENWSEYTNWSEWKEGFDSWQEWTTASRNNKGLHWDVIMGSLYTSHIEKEQKTLERLSNDVKSQLNSMYLAKDDPSALECRTIGNVDFDQDGFCNTKVCSEEKKKADECIHPTTCYQEIADAGRSDWYTNKHETCLNNCRSATLPCDTLASYECNTQYCEVVPSGADHYQSPIQISMKDTKLAYTALVECLKASVNKNDYPTYLDLVQKRDPNGGIAQQAFHDQADFGEDKDLVPDSANPDTNETSDYLLLLKTKQAHYNLQSSYECSNEEMNFEVRLYKMSKLENRYKLLYLYCKCDLTTQIKKFKKMVNTLCVGTQSMATESGHCYTKMGSTKKREAYNRSTGHAHHTNRSCRAKPTGFRGSSQRETFCLLQDNGFCMRKKVELDNCKTDPTCSNTEAAGVLSGCLSSCEDELDTCPGYNPDPDPDMGGEIECVQQGKKGCVVKNEDDREQGQDHVDFVGAITQSECDIDEKFCPERVFYYSNEGVSNHKQAPCSGCADLGGDYHRGGSYQ